MNTSRPSPAPSLPVSRSTHGKRRHFRKRQAPLATEIVERLLLGNYEASEDCELLQRHHVTRVLSVLESAPDRDRIATAGIEYDNVPLADSKQADLLAVLERAVATIERWLAQGHTVLVHCRSGKSRSVAVVLAVLLHRGQQQQQQTPVVSSVAQVLAQVRARHPAALPNKSFLLQLALYHYSGCRVNALVHDGLHQWQLQLPHYQLPSTLGPEGATATATATDGVGDQEAFGTTLPDTTASPPPDWVAVLTQARPNDDQHADAQVAAATVRLIEWLNECFFAEARVRRYRYFHMHCQGSWQAEATAET